MWRSVAVPLAAILAVAAVAACGDDEVVQGAEDAGRVEPDAARPADAGEQPDAALPEDAGLLPDAGLEPDAGLLVPVVDLRADVDRDGVVSLDDPAEDLDEEGWDRTHGAVFLANLDDDRQVCPKLNGTRQLTDIELAQCHDAADLVINGDDDLLDLAPLRVKAWPDAPDGAVGTLALSQPGAAHARLFRRTLDNSVAVFDPATSTLETRELRVGVELYLEGTDIVRDSSVWDGFLDVTLTVGATMTGGAQLSESDTVRFRIAPVITHHHLSPVETLYATVVPNENDSTLFRRDLRTALAASSVTNPLAELDVPDYDQWTQDYFESGYMAMPAPGGQHVIRVAYRSANVYEPRSQTNPLRPAGKVVFTVLRGKDFAGIQEFSRTSDPNMDTLNSFGNTEAIPPYSKDGVDYPFGRVARGSVPSYHPDLKFSRMLESQGMQPPVLFDTSWLLVAHIDETITYLPASTPRGWIVLVNDPVLARQMLQDEADRGNGSVRMFVGQYWYDWDTGNPYSAAVSINQVLDDTEVMGESQRSAVEVDAQVAILKRETGVTDAEIIKIPYLHQPVDGYSLAYQPGTVNGVLLDDHTYLAPDPHGPVIDGRDLFKVQLEDALAPYGYTVQWVENWGLYHALAGEVHCGSNATRAIPAAKWWETGR